MGVILFTLLCGKLPFTGKSFKEIKENILDCNPRIPIEQGVNLTYECRHLLGSLITYPKYRLTLEEIIKHPWFNGTQMENSDR